MSDFMATTVTECPLLKEGVRLGTMCNDVEFIHERPSLLGHARPGFRHVNGAQGQTSAAFGAAFVSWHVPISPGSWEALVPL